MDIQQFLIHIQHIHWLTVMKNYHARHYMFEMAKILIPALITGVITFLAMRITDSRNKKRWLNDGHIKRKTELEIEIRKFLLGIKANASDEYYALAEWYAKKDEDDNEEIDSELVQDFKENLEALFKYLQSEESESNSNISGYKRIFSLMDEYVCYVPKMGSYFNAFKNLYNEIFDLKTIYENGGYHSFVIDCNVLEEIKKIPEYIDMINTYLAFIDIIEKILNKLMVKKIIK